MTCRDAVLRAVQTLTGGRRDVTFTPPEVIAVMLQSGTPYRELTIRSYVTGTLCAPELDPTGRRTQDLVRVGRGRYRLR